MKKIKIPNKLRATMSKLDIAVSLGIVPACIGTLVVSSIQFKNSLTNINSNIASLNTLPHRPLFVSEHETQTYANEEIQSAWKKKYPDDKSPNLTIAQMSEQLSMQPCDPGILADLIVVGTYTGHKQYRYRSFVADIRINEVQSPLANTSKFTTGTVEKDEHKIPSLNLHEGDIIKVYDELALRATRSGDREITACADANNPYTRYLAPFRPNKQYLFFLNCATRPNVVDTNTARFKIVSSLYARIAVSKGKTFEPNIFCANLSTQNSAKKTIQRNPSASAHRKLLMRTSSVVAKKHAQRCQNLSTVTQVT